MFKIFRAFSRDSGILDLINKRPKRRQKTNNMETLKEQVDRLANFIGINFGEGYPNQSEGAIDTAMRIITDLQNHKIPEDCNWRRTFDSEKKEFEGGKSLPIPYVLIPSDKNGEDIIGEPDIAEHFLITSQLIEIDGKHYDKLEYLPDYVSLCGGGNGERIRGNKVRFLKEEPESV